MIESSGWQSLTVQTFLERYNWSGKPAIFHPEPDESSPTAWQHQTVNTFFQNLNWTGQLVKQVSGATSHGFSPRLNVEDFFNCFVWERSPNIASLPDISQAFPPSDEDDLDLDEFSNLF